MLADAATIDGNDVGALDAKQAFRHLKRATENVACLLSPLRLEYIMDAVNPDGRSSID